MERIIPNHRQMVIVHIIDYFVGILKVTVWQEMPLNTGSITLEIRVKYSQEILEEKVA